MAYSNLWPRLASVNAARNATQANTFARYQCLIATRKLAYNGGSDGVHAIKQVNAGCTALAYVPITIQALGDYDTTNQWFYTVNLPGGGVAGLVVDPQWWLGVAPAPGSGAVGATFSSWPLGGSGTGNVTVNSTLALQPPYGPAMNTSTVMLIDTGANTEIVVAKVVDSTTVTIQQRLQYYGGYPMNGINHSMSQTPFIRIMAYQFANAALFNCSLFSAVSPVDNKTYGQRLGAYMGQVLSTSSSWDGIHGDNAVLSYYASGSGNLKNQALDANNDNVGDGGDGGLLGYGWRDGMAGVLATVQSLLGGKLLVCNNGYVDGVSNGRLIESFTGLALPGSSEFQSKPDNTPYAAGPINNQWQGAYAFQDDLAAPSRTTKTTISSADVLNSTPLAVLNPASTTLSAQVRQGDTSINVTSATPLNGAALLAVGGDGVAGDNTLEIVSCSQISTSTANPIAVTRGVYGTQVPLVDNPADS